MYVHQEYIGLRKDRTIGQRPLAIWAWPPGNPASSVTGFTESQDPLLYLLPRFHPAASEKGHSSLVAGLMSRISPTRCVPRQMAGF